MNIINNSNWSKERMRASIIIQYKHMEENESIIL